MVAPKHAKKKVVSKHAKSFAPRHAKRVVSRNGINAVSECQQRMLIGVASLMLGGAMAMGAPNLALAEDIESVDSPVSESSDGAVPQESAEVVEDREASADAAETQDSSERKASDQEADSVLTEEAVDAQGPAAFQGSAPDSDVATDVSDDFEYEGTLSPDQAIDTMQKILGGLKDGSTAVTVAQYNLDDIDADNPLYYLIAALTGYNPSNDYSNVDVSDLPKAYSLRTDGAVGSVNDDGGVNVVTVVKNQSPFGSCWSFATIAASESSVLAEAYAKWALLGPESDFDTFEEFAQSIDFSEKHLAWFVKVPLNDESSPQNGEGSKYIGGSEDKNARLDAGGFVYFGTSMFASGVGPVYEKDAPYASKEYLDGDPYAKQTGNDRDYEISLPSGVVLEYEDTGERITLPDRENIFPVYYDSDGIRHEVSKISIPSEDDDSVITVVTVTDSDGKERDYDPNIFTKRYFDWSVDDEERFQTAFELEESFILPERDSNEADPVEAVASMVEAIKRQLLAGRAVSACFYADQSKPGQDVDSYKYLNPNNNIWAHYTYDGNLVSNHAVTIVGYNDDFPVEYFIQQPPAAGAWLVKNSWGGGKSEGLNSGDWGIDEDGLNGGDGYFWLSYYDKSIDLPESFDFKVEDLATDRREYSLDQHDFLPARGLDGYVTVSSTDEMSMANVFHVDEAVNIREVGITTTGENQTVFYEIYLLPSDYQDPTSNMLLASGKSNPFEYSGYHRIVLDDLCIIPANAYYSIVTTVMDESGKYHASMAGGTSEEYAKSMKNSVCNLAVVNARESYMFFSSDGWSDLLENAVWILDGLGPESIYDMLDNFPIKAYADYLLGDITAFAPQVDPTNGIDMGVTTRTDAEHKAKETLQGVFDEIQQGIASDESEKVFDGVVSAETYDALIEAAADFYNNPFFAVYTALTKTNLAQDIVNSFTDAGLTIARAFSIDSIIKRYDPYSEMPSEDVVFGNLLKFDKPISFSIAIPKDLIIPGREFFIYGSDGKRIDVVLADGMAVFLTDIATGDFALAYVDAPIPNPVKPVGAHARYDVQGPQTPATGDSNGAAIALSAAMLSAGVAALARRKRFQV